MDKSPLSDICFENIFTIFLMMCLKSKHFEFDEVLIVFIY